MGWVSRKQNLRQNLVCEMLECPNFKHCGHDRSEGGFGQRSCCGPILTEAITGCMGSPEAAVLELLS